MKFSLIVSVADEYTSRKSHIVSELSHLIDKHLLNSFFGEDLLEIQVSIMMVQIRPGYENWYVPKKPNFVFNKIVLNKYTYESRHLKKLFQYEFLLTGKLLDNFVEQSDDESRLILLNAVIESLHFLDKLPSKVKDFDKDAFRIAIKKLSISI